MEAVVTLAQTLIELTNRLSSNGHETYLINKDELGLAMMDIDNMQGINKDGELYDLPNKYTEISSGFNPNEAIGGFYGTCATTFHGTHTTNDIVTYFIIVYDRNGYTMEGRYW